MKKVNLIYGILGFILGGVITFFVFNPPSNEMQNAEGKLGDCPVRMYKVGEMIYSQCTIKHLQPCTFEDRSGCVYILRNVGNQVIKAGESVSVMRTEITENGSQYLEVAHPSGYVNPPQRSEKQGENGGGTQ